LSFFFSLWKKKKKKKEKEKKKKKVIKAERTGTLQNWDQWRFSKLKNKTKQGKSKI